MSHVQNTSRLQQLVPDFNQELYEQSSIYRAQLMQLCSRQQANQRAISLQAARGNEESESFVLGYN
ncbi:hypothetical protein J7384_14960 [Endozoicomonas sp. G2_1]|uniref:hypothetical protein n=1 Tax=Endozoicomonas sp. G2_1 TaxID=2821091 RepID=UPI001ADC10F2|nr:hypothetical protein [Endozoicomonas sp. G2_1]MBO9491666.1 hypothetical protein [Endozoicomonas sp. G2_1]